jgi:hypothetical protein
MITYSFAVTNTANVTVNEAKKIVESLFTGTATPQPVEREAREDGTIRVGAGFLPREREGRHHSGWCRPSALVAENRGKPGC